MEKLFPLGVVLILVPAGDVFLIHLLLLRRVRGRLGGTVDDRGLVLAHLSEVLGLHVAAIVSFLVVGSFVLFSGPVAVGLLDAPGGGGGLPGGLGGQLLPGSLPTGGLASGLLGGGHGDAGGVDVKDTLTFHEIL